MLGFSHFYRLNTLILGQFPCFSGIFHIKPFDRPIFLNYPENLQSRHDSRAGAYELAHSKSFPAMLVGSRIVVPKDRLSAWVDRKVSERI